MLAGAPIRYASKRQHCIALSSTEAELMAASQAATEIAHTREVLAELGMPQDAPTELYVDNTVVQRRWHVSARSRTTRGTFLAATSRCASTRQMGC